LGNSNVCESSQTGEHAARVTKFAV